MQKTIITILILLLLLVGGVLVFYPFPESTDNSPDLPDNPEKNKETPKQQKQVDKNDLLEYLEKSTLETNYDDKVFADYYKLGREDNKLFIWAYVAERYYENGKLQLGSARSTPLVVTLSPDGGVKDHWEPAEGERYASSIKQEFPKKYWNDVLNFQTEHRNVLTDLKQTVKRKAKNQLSLGTEKADRILSVGEVATVTLESNRSTGYDWDYKIGNKNVVEIVSDNYRQGGNKDVVGAPGQRIFEVKALNPGTTEVIFEYSRDWENKQPEKTKQIIIKVREKKQAKFSLPQGWNREYISIQDGQVEIEESSEKFNVEEKEILCPQEFTSETIKNRKYCVRETSEGAAGTVKKDYTYATIKKDRLIKVDFTAVLPQCGNYTDPQRSECKKEKEQFNPDGIADNIVAQTNF